MIGKLVVVVDVEAWVCSSCGESGCIDLGSSAGAAAVVPAAAAHVASAAETVETGTDRTAVCSTSLDHYLQEVC